MRQMYPFKSSLLYCLQKNQFTFANTFWYFGVLNPVLSCRRSPALCSRYRPALRESGTQIPVRDTQVPVCTKIPVTTTNHMYVLLGLCLCLGWWVVLGIGRTNRQKWFCVGCFRYFRAWERNWLQIIITPLPPPPKHSKISPKMAQPEALHSPIHVVDPNASLHRDVHPRARHAFGTPATPSQGCHFRRANVACSRRPRLSQSG